MKKILYILVFVLIASNIAMAAGNDVPQNRNLAQGLVNPYTVDTKFIEKGKSIYTKNCAVCHTASGEEPNYHSLQAMGKHHSEGDYVWVVSYGLNKTMGPGVMPAWQNKLSLEDRWAVVTYIREKLAK